MAKTAFTTNDASTVKKWNEQLYRDWRKVAYFPRFFGSEMEGLVLEKNDFLKGKGDKITFTLIHRLTGAGVSEGITLEGNEEALDSSTFALTLEETAHGVRDRGPMDRQRPLFDITAKSATALEVWGGEKVDEKCFTALDTTPRVMIYTADGSTWLGTTTLATAKAALTANSKLTLNFISFLKTWAMTGGNRSQTPIRPVMIDGEMFYVLLTHPDSLFDLKTSTAWQQAQREAQRRGPTNPIFRGAKAVWDDVIIHAHENITVGTDGGAGGAGAWCHAHFMGAGALAVSWGMKPNIVQENFDYKREIGHGLDMIFVSGKPTFAYSGTTRDYGTISAIVTRTNVGGITIT